jgi:hypothetical protein
MVEYPSGRSPDDESILRFTAGLFRGRPRQSLEDTRRYPEKKVSQRYHTDPLGVDSDAQPSILSSASTFDPRSQRRIEARSQRGKQSANRASVTWHTFGQTSLHRCQIGQHRRKRSDTEKQSLHGGTARSRLSPMGERQKKIPYGTYRDGSVAITNNDTTPTVMLGDRFESTARGCWNRRIPHKGDGSSIHRRVAGCAVGRQTQKNASLLSGCKLLPSRYCRYGRLALGDVEGLSLACSIHDGSSE